MKKETIMYQLLNYQNNKEMIALIPHIRYLDLAIVFYSPLAKEKEEDPPRYGLLTWKGMEALELELEELETLAAQNTIRRQGACLLELGEVVEQLPGEKRRERGEVPMYVLTNKAHLFGAACILYPGLLCQLGRLFDADLYVLPSSIHECILVPDKYAGMTKETLSAVVRHVNKTQVPIDEMLSDQVYSYQKATDKLLI